MDMYVEKITGQYSGHALNRNLDLREQSVLEKRALDLKICSDFPKI